MRMTVICAAALLTALVAAPSIGNAEEGKTFPIGEKYLLTAPAKWISKEPRSRIVEFEFEVPAFEGDSTAGRVTVMGAGGGVEANIDRWKGQFKAGEGENVAADVKKLTVSGQEVHLVDIKGTYLDKPGPFVPGPGVECPNYRMLGAVIVTKDAGQYFVKMYGPANTVGAAEPGFKKMIDGMKAK